MLQVYKVYGIERLMKTIHSKPEHITLLTHEYPPFPGGIGTYCAQIAIAMAKLGTKVDVWAPDFGVSTPKQENNLPIKHLYFKGGVFKKWQFPRILWLTLLAIWKKPKGSILLAGIGLLLQRAVY